MDPIISVVNASKTYASGFHALDHVDLQIQPGEIFALLGPNGAGKTTLIGMICGIVKLGEGSIKVAGKDIVADYRRAFGAAPPAVTGVIVSADTDNTGESVESYFGDIEFRSRPTS